MGWPGGLPGSTGFKFNITTVLSPRGSGVPIQISLPASFGLIRAHAMAIFPMTFTADKSSNLPRAFFLKPMCGLPHFAISNWGRLGVTQPQSPGQTHCAHRHRPAANTGPEEDKATRLDTEHCLPPVTFSRHYNVPGCRGWGEGWGSNAGLS